MRRGLRVEAFGDGDELLSLIGEGRSGDADAPVVALGVIRAPEPESVVDYWGFRREARARLAEEVAELRPAMLVLVIDAADRRRTDRAVAATKSLVSDAAHGAALLTDDGELPVIGVVVHSPQERELLAPALSPSRFERSSADDSDRVGSVAGRLCVSLCRLGFDVFTGPRVVAPYAHA